MREEEEEAWERGKKGKVEARKEGGKVRVITPWLHTSPWEGKERSKRRNGGWEKEEGKRRQAAPSHPGKHPSPTREHPTHRHRTGLDQAVPRNFTARPHRNPCRITPETLYHRLKPPDERNQDAQSMLTQLKIGNRKTANSLTQCNIEGFISPY